MVEKIESFKLGNCTIINVKREKNIKDKLEVYNYTYSYGIKNQKGRIIRDENGKPERWWQRADNLKQLKDDIKRWINSIE